MKDIKLCPFCGSVAVVREDTFCGVSKGFCVVCTGSDCFCTLGEGYDRDAIPDHCFSTEQEAIKAWNTRAEVKHD